MFGSSGSMYCTLLYATVLYCNVLYCTLLPHPMLHLNIKSRENLCCGFIVMVDLDLMLERTDESFIEAA